MIRSSLPSGPLAVAVLAAGTLLLSVCNTDEPFTEAPPDDLGKVCSLDSECTYGCTYGAVGSHDHCTRRCDTQVCPAGYACVARGHLGQVCAVGPCSGNAGCPADYTCYSDENVEQVCRHVDIPCGADTDCPGLYACNQGLCVLVCADDVDCKQGYRCSGSLGCAQCDHPGECPNGFACIGGLCNSACAEERDCRNGFECITGACAQIQGGGTGAVGAPCAEDSECADFCYQDYQCSRLCNGADDTTSCPAGSHCEGYQLVCTPG
jgi:hypothetical protein